MIFGGFRVCLCWVFYYGFKAGFDFGYLQFLVWVGLADFLRFSGVVLKSA